MASTETKALDIRTINNFAVIISNLHDEALGQDGQNIKVAHLLNLRYYAHMLEHIVGEALDYALKQED